MKRPCSRKYRIQRWSLAQQKNQQASPSPDSPPFLTNQDNLDGLLGCLCAYQAMRREFTRTFGSWAMAWMMFQPCFLAVAMNERMVAKSVAPAMQRKPPEIFCLTFIMRASRSA